MADHGVLLDAAKEVGLEGDIEAFLRSDAKAMEVQRDIVRFRQRWVRTTRRAVGPTSPPPSHSVAGRYPINGVPFFIFNEGKAVVSGAEESAGLLGSIERAMGMAEGSEGEEEEE